MPSLSPSPKKPPRKTQNQPKSTPSTPLPRSNWTYIHLVLTSTSGQHHQPPLDALTARTYLAAALSQFLGHTGGAIPVDILAVGTSAYEAYDYDQQKQHDYDQQQNDGQGRQKHDGQGKRGEQHGEQHGEQDREQDMYIRVPREDGNAVVAAVGGWVGSGSGSSGSSGSGSGSGSGPGSNSGGAGGGGGGGGVSWRVRAWGEWAGAVVFGGVEGGVGLFEGEGE
ncbi:hypothetical protein EJ05DRAFT_513961 [Pseudovirgaria hyperparasitica]|uniref:Ribonucleases P/MRP subunit Pop8-like domain-containing protein n=1 Tax=Pseudovirgaria hyperparasitica TaxID=470096 RepID=A0A6A6VW65_9PEZI|nr:uncharacterized protein EJ05DRAFT_513961 [Pseudovirgaria hyperparasitica]KAF2754483.1 hypothetical protein EJ05DRAFT_513961 [Pseudovirgaria hyperparasitica]